jgi:trehalose 2-sulfotransferase
MMLPSPETSFLVCATPRSGSTLLCELLGATGIAGRPQEYFERLYATNLPRQPRQYLEGVDDPSVLTSLAPTQSGVPESAESFEARLSAALLEGTTPNGVWSAKLMWGYMLDFLRRLRERPQTADLRPPEAIESLLPGVRYVHVRRRDKVAQAVSLWTAVQTARWREESDEADGPPPEPVYSYPAIEHLVDQVTKQDQAWTAWFAAAGIQPEVVVYEELTDARHKTVCGLLRSLQIDVHGVEVPEPSMRRQSNGRSRDWAERFESERKASLV